MVYDSIYLNRPIGSNAQTVDAARRAAFGHFILRKIIATRCQILRLKYTKIYLGWALAQAPLGELAALSQTGQTLAGIKGTYF